MKVCIVHNRYRSFSGEEAVVEQIQKMLELHGHQVIPYFRSSSEISNMFLGSFRAFFSGIYNYSSRRTFRKMLIRERPDIIHIHNLFPLISPSILPERNMPKAPIVMTVHNYRLVCPNGLHYVRNSVCERCVGGKEYWCVLLNCEGALFKSIGYALRTWVARKKRYFLDNVNLFVCLTEFQRNQLVKGGVPGDRITVLPNMAVVPEWNGGQTLGDYVGYAGRLSPEKGIHILLDAARMCPNVPFAAVGSYERLPDLPAVAPSNFKCLGYYAFEKLQDFYRRSRIVVLASTWFEGFPIMVAEAMLHGKPVIAPRIGGCPEIIDDGVTGLLFEPNNAEDLANKVDYLWGRPQLCRQMGSAGHKKALREYSIERYYNRLMALYEKSSSFSDPKIEQV